MFATAARASTAYRRLAVESAAFGADRHQLIAMLFANALGAIAEARAALAAGQVATKAEATTRAIRIVDEGLKCALDRGVGPLAEQLYALYDYCARRLLYAHARSHDAAYQEAASLLSQVSDAWSAIRPSAAPATRGAA